MNKCFAKVSRPITEPGKGAYWTVDLEAGEGNKRPRKRNKKPKQNKNHGGAADDDFDDDDDEDLTGSEFSRSFSPDSGVQRDRVMYAGKSSQDRPTYSYPPPPPPSSMIAGSSMHHAHHTRQGTPNSMLGYSTHPHSGQARRIPVQPLMGPMGEGRLRGDEDEFSD